MPRRRRLLSAAALFLLLLLLSPVPAGAQTDPSLAQYLQSVANLIAAQQDYPIAARRLDQQGEVRLRLTVDRQGGLLDVGLGKSSGFPILDQAAMEMARRAFPLPPPPPSLSGEPVVFDAPIRFRLEE